MVTLLSLASARFSMTAFCENGHNFAANTPPTRKSKAVTPAAISHALRCNVTNDQILSDESPACATLTVDDMKLGVTVEVKCWYCPKEFLVPPSYPFSLIAEEPKRDKGWVHERMPGWYDPE